MRSLNPFRQVNQFDRWLADETKAVQELFESGRIAQPLMDVGQLMGHPMFPEPFQITQSIVTPAVGTIDATILDYTLDAGYAAIINATGHRYIGTNYIESAGFIKWNYYIEYRLVPNYINLIEQFGDVQQPRPAIKGLPVFAGQRVQIRADVLSTVSTGAPNRLMATISGVKYAIR